MNLLDEKCINELRAYMRCPTQNCTELWQKIDAFARSAFALKHCDVTADLANGKLAFRFDEHDQSALSVPGQAGMNYWVWHAFISSRGPLISCRTFKVDRVVLGEEVLGGTHYSPELPPRPPAVEWTRQLAAEFDLCYVDASALRDWEVSYDDVDPQFQYALQHDSDSPSAFQVLFLEY